MYKVNLKKLPKDKSKTRMPARIRGIRTIAEKENELHQIKRVHYHYYKKAGGKRTLSSITKHK